jgi:hypothetical protein
MFVDLLKWYFDLTPRGGEVGYFDPEDIGRNLEAILDEQAEEPSGDFNFGERSKPL